MALSKKGLVYRTDYPDMRCPIEKVVHPFSPTVARIWFFTGGTYEIWQVRCASIGVKYQELMHTAGFQRCNLNG